MQIVQMKQCHIDEIIKLEQACFSTPWTKNMFLNELQNPLTLYYIALMDEKPVAYMGMWQISGEGHITNVAVNPAYRRQGIGRSMIGHFIRMCEARGLSLLTLEVRKSNVPAISLYQSFGFEEVGFRKNYYAQPEEDALIMTLVLEQK